jgi:MFS family permease
VTPQDAAAGSPGHEADVTTGLAGRETATPTSWLPITVLALAQFVMVLDSTVMNVSLSTIQADLNTTIAMLQLAITLFTLTMAALMLAAGPLIGGLATTYLSWRIVFVGEVLALLVVMAFVECRSDEPSRSEVRWERHGAGGLWPEAPRRLTKGTPMISTPPGP